MLSASDSGTNHFRYQNVPQSSNNPKSSNIPLSKFLPSNYYPIQTPGFTVQWTKRKFEIIERIGETAKTAFEFDLMNMSHYENVQLFNTIPKHKIPHKRFKMGIFQNWSGWIYKTFTGETWKKETLEIVQILPLMFDETAFDALIITKQGGADPKAPLIGFIRTRLLITGNLKNIQKFTDFIPALPVKISENSPSFATWKHLIFAFDGLEIKFINLQNDRNEWKSLTIPSLPVDKIIICEDKFVDNFIVLLLKNSGENSSSFNLVKFDSVSEQANLLNLSIPCESNETCGYIENDNLYLIQGQNLYEIELNSCEIEVFLLQDTFQLTNSHVYLFPWRQDLKVSALLFYLTLQSQSYSYKISIMSLCGTKSEIILESDWFESEHLIQTMFATSSLELFLLDEGGNVQVYSGLLENTDWPWRHNRPVHNVIFEFTHWFNILGEFPFKPKEYYNSRRLQVNDTLFIDDLLQKTTGTEFPPTNWKSLGMACRQLKDENINLILYYLLAANTNPTKLHSFYSQFGLIDRQVSAIELAYACDHGDYGKVSNIYCTRRIEEEDRSKFTKKIINFMKSSDNTFISEELTIFSLYSAGRIISIDLLLEDESLMCGMLESILKCRNVPVALDWIKGLFAWLRPDDRCALIPVASLHQTLIIRLLDIILKLNESNDFKRLGNEFNESKFDPEMLRTILNHLSENLTDRSAWMITMICAIRSRFHEYLLKFNFEDVKDEELLGGIDNIRQVIWDSFKDNNLRFNFGYENEEITSEFNNNCDFKNNCDYKNNWDTKNNTPPCHLSPTNPSNSNSNSNSSSPSSSLIKVYARTPTSPKGSPISINYQSKINSSTSTSTFTPRHYPPKRPTTLKTRSSDLNDDVLVHVDGEEDEMNPFISGKRLRNETFEDLMKLKNETNNLKYASKRKRA